MDNFEIMKAASEAGRQYDDSVRQWIAVSAAMQRGIHEERLPDWKFFSSEEVVLSDEHSRFWTPAALPDWVEPGMKKECFANAFELVNENLDLTYVEGFALGIITTLHAWAVTPDGEVIDPTWDEPENAEYFGIPFDIEWVQEFTDRTGCYGVLGNDYVFVNEIYQHGLPQEAYSLDF